MWQQFFFFFLSFCSHRHHSCFLWHASLPASPLFHQSNRRVLSNAFPKVLPSGHNPTPLSLVQLQQEGEDIFIGLRGHIFMAATVSKKRVIQCSITPPAWMHQRRQMSPAETWWVPALFQPTMSDPLQTQKSCNLFLLLHTIFDWICAG